MTLSERIERLEMAVMLLPSNEDYATQAATIAKLREALGFYARENNWRSMSKYMCGHSGETTATIDGGKRARQALADTGEG